MDFAVMEGVKMNKQKYIETEKFVEHFGDWYTEEGTENGFIGTIKDLVEQMPVTDVVEVVRCKECANAPKCFRDVVMQTKSGGNLYCPLTFCSEGKRKDG